MSDVKQILLVLSLQLTSERTKTLLTVLLCIFTTEDLTCKLPVPSCTNRVLTKLPASCTIISSRAKKLQFNCIPYARRSNL